MKKKPTDKSKRVTSAWHCKNCGSIQDLSKGYICENCMSDLSLSGEIIKIEIDNDTDDNPSIDDSLDCEGEDVRRNEDEKEPDIESIDTILKNLGEGDRKKREEELRRLEKELERLEREEEQEIKRQEELRNRKEKEDARQKQNEEKQKKKEEKRQKQEAATRKKREEDEQKRQAKEESEKKRLDEDFKKRKKALEERREALQKRKNDRLSAASDEVPSVKEVTVSDSTPVNTDKKPADVTKKRKRRALPLVILSIFMILIIAVVIAVIMFIPGRNDSGIIPDSVKNYGHAAPANAVYLSVDPANVIHDGKGTWENNVTYTAAAAFDMDPGTFYDCDEKCEYTNTDAENVGMYDFDSWDGNTKKTGYVGAYFEGGVYLTQIRWIARVSEWERNVGGYFEASADGATWTTVCAITEPSSGADYEIIDISGKASSTAYTYIRYVGPKDGYCNIGEIEFWGNYAD